MSHLYPLAFTGREALDGVDHAARSKADAQRLCTLDGHHIKGLETEWLTLEPSEISELDPKAAAGFSAGFVQRYENAQGATVLAITYWNIAPIEQPSETPPEVQAQSADEPAEQDHTDDLYFRQGRTKPRRRKKPDPNQMDLFRKPDA
ncbi:MAG: hypothetical protein ABJG15_03975 [Hyphomonadaceae bacterium]